MIIINNLEKILFSIGPVKIHWYGFAYFIGFLFAIFLTKLIEKKYKIFSQNHLYTDKNKIFDKFFLYMIFSVIIGGRLGYIIFYNLEYYIKNPIEIFFIWHGGMAFHGAFFGIILSLYVFSRKYKINFLILTDLVSFICLPGIFFGRIANFINMELMGKFSDLPFAVLFPFEDFPRHPSQIYEAIFEGLFIFIVFVILIFKFKFFEKDFERKGYITMIFLILYSISRFIIEMFFRIPDSHLGYFILNKFSLGQFFCFIMLLLSFLVFFLRKFLQYTKN